MIEPFEYSGIFWLPKEPDRHVSGVLKFDPEDRTILELIGSFKETTEFGKFGMEEIILGVASNGKLITLYKCLDYGFQLTRFVSSKYLVNYVLFGHHFPTAESIVFKNLSVDYEHLHEWTRITGFKWRLEDNKDGGSAQETVSYSFPETVSASVNDTTFSFHHNYSSGGDRIQDIILKQTTFWKIEPNHECHYQIYHEQICYHIQNFLTLAISQPVRPKRIVGKAEAAKQILQDGKVVYTDVDVLYSTGHRVKGRKIGHPHEMLFLFNDIRDHFQTCLTNWFSKAKLLGSVYDLYFGMMYNDSMYIHQEFITLAQALESYHRRVRNGTYTDPAGFAPIYDRLVGAIPEGTAKDFRDSMTSKLKYFAEYSLRRRLTELLAETADLVPKAGLNQGQVVEDIVNTRNYLTHYDESLAAKAKEGQELYELTHLMQMIMRILFMLELGIPRELVGSLLKRHAVYR